MPSSTQQRGHDLATDERSAWLQRNTFECPVYGARISPQTCAANRKRPLLTDGAGINPTGKETHFRHPKCGDDCATWIEQKTKNAGATSTSANTKRGCCANCERDNMALIAGMCAPCNNLRKEGLIIQGEDCVWRPTGQCAKPSETPCEEHPQIVAGSISPADTLEIADEWEPYTRLSGHPQTHSPAASVNRAQDLVINTAAVRGFDLVGVSHVRLLFNRKTLLVALEPMTGAKHPDALKLTVPSGKRDVRVVAFKGFMRAFGLTARLGVSCPITQGVDGKLIVALELEPTQGEEAA